ncbi:SHOCT domain-containing protein [Maribacter sp. PR1]|jgi:putative membrane protein|uniref:SHOCT domain-containing protein n=2 Tax=Flavobacteriaceae TaxID=49546 RepID=A0ABU7ITL3_9FLAO|nr:MULTISPECIES: SHOCT domain-containing protein [Flavobacteriaceae]ASO05811.1 membrane protein [Arenibacter algicola]MDC6388925.1 SHOCT domain-containing protein [Maribacter sp. PR1]MEE1976313.1 SHOCT domain-containing protein [Maribacter cobaltidurans]|tara:strand:- start:20693 stop:20911 length:219 start_codon:yes stop_codon:yes gene_type:complete
MFYRDGVFWGMHLIWWAIWFVLLGWIFFAPSSSSYDEIEDDDPLTSLKRRFAKGEITKSEYEESKKLLKSDG